MRTPVFEQLVQRVKSEFVEMPGLRLTAEQCSRLWGVEREKCDSLLHALVQGNFLVVRADGKYGRAVDMVARDVPLRAAKASLEAGPTNAGSASTAARQRDGVGHHATEIAHRRRGLLR
jgi:hypothetical protein